MMVGRRAEAASVIDGLPTYFVTVPHVTEWEIAMGRPPIGKVAMTGAERVRRYGTRKHVRAAMMQSLAQGDLELMRIELAQAKARLAELEAEIARPQAGHLVWTKSAHALDAGHYGWSARHDGGEYTVNPTMAAPSGKFSGYTVGYRKGQARRELIPVETSVSTAAQGKALAEADFDAAMLLLGRRSGKGGK
jgi:hypothetical protein